MKWQPISTAEKVPGKEILGTKWAWDGSRMVCTRDPFVSFWSPSLGKFYSTPTHWIPCPEAPDKMVSAPEKAGAARSDRRGSE